MGSPSPETSSCASSTFSPTHTHQMISRMSSSESSLGSSIDSATSLQRRSKKQATNLVFPYAPAIVAEPYTITSEAEPLKSIPPCLIPKDTMCQLPPILHFGWSIDEDKLLEWCATEGFQRTTTDINGHYVFDYTGTVAAALHYFAQRSGAEVFDPYIQLTSHRGEPVIIAIASNYTGSDELDERRWEIFALGSLLQKEGLLNRTSEAARWYIDFKEWQWVVNGPK